MKKRNTSHHINKLLYEERIKRKKSVKECAKHLGILRLHLYLIEHGYLNVGERLQEKFIRYYKLPADFFDTNSTFAVPIVTNKIDEKGLKKYRQKAAKKWVKIYASISVFTSICCVAFGIYALNRKQTTPRAAWTENYTQFRDEMITRGTKSIDPLELDETRYFQIEVEAKTEKRTIKTAINIFTKETNSAETYFEAEVTDYEDETLTKSTDTYNYYIFALNKNVVVYCTYRNDNLKFTIPVATGFLDKGLNFSLRAFDYLENGVSKRAQKGSEIYNTYYNKFSETLGPAFDKVDTLLVDNNLVYSKSIDLIYDVQKISRDYYLFSRLGFSFTLVFSCTLAVFAVVLSYSIYCSYQLNPKKKKEKEVKYCSIISRDIPIRGIVNDARYPAIIPEFVLKIVGIGVLALSSIALFASVYMLFNADFAGFKDANAIKAMTSNFLSSAVLILFFIKLDVYSRKTNMELLTNIIGLFIGGLMFYIAEILLYNIVISQGDAFSILLQSISQVIPGNVIWNIMLYSLIFYFLFTVPKKYENSPAKILRWRLFSIIPTLLLIFALLYKFFLEQMIPSAYYFSFLFHTSGIIPTLFAIFYVYSLYFLKLRSKLTFGEKNAEVYSYSRWFAIEKNVIACTIILILFAIDMFFRYKVPDNILKLGKNWSIALLIPFIMFYRPHIGARNKTWDRIYIILYGSAFAGGYISIALFVLSKINLGDLFAILF